MMKGKLYGEGLAGDFEEDDMSTALVRELLSDTNLGESADAVWASLAAEQGRVLSFDPTSGYRSEPVDTLVRKEQSAEDTPAITNRSSRLRDDRATDRNRALSPPSTHHVTCAGPYGARPHTSNPDSCRCSS